MNINRLSKNIASIICNALNEDFNIMEITPQSINDDKTINDFCDKWSNIDAKGFDDVRQRLSPTILSSCIMPLDASIVKKFKSAFTKMLNILASTYMFEVVEKPKADKEFNSMLRYVIAYMGHQLEITIDMDYPNQIDEYDAMLKHIGIRQLRDDVETQTHYVSLKEIPSCIYQLSSSRSYEQGW